MCNVFRDVTKRVGIEKARKRTSLLWKFNGKKGESRTYVDEDLERQITNGVQERLDLLEAWAAHHPSPR